MTLRAMLLRWHTKAIMVPLEDMLAMVYSVDMVELVDMEVMADIPNDE